MVARHAHVASVVRVGLALCNQWAKGMRFGNFLGYLAPKPDDASKDHVS